LKKLATISFLLIFIFSCENKFPDYLKKKDGIYMKLISFDDDKKFDKKLYTSANILFSDNDTIIYKRYKEDIIRPENNDFDFILSYLSEGDSAHFKVQSEIIRRKFNNVSLSEIDVDYIDVKIKINQFLNLEEYNNRYDNYDGEMIEQILLSNYLNDNKNDAFRFVNGMYIKTINKGKGIEIQKGDVISIKYKSNFTNRLEFDNNYKKSAFTFTYGTPEQVIKGLDIAINGMKKGEKSKIIIPSHLAFGEEGSSTQIVPPFTTVIYELEIVNVKQAVPEIIIEKLN
jgi:hypothetical protein